MALSATFATFSIAACGVPAGARMPNHRLVSKFGIPASAIDPTSAKLMALYPAQNLPGVTSNYLYNPGQQTSVDQYDIRFDYRTGASSLFGRVSRENPDTVTPGFLPAPAIGGGPS